MGAGCLAVGPHGIHRRAADRKRRAAVRVLATAQPGAAPQPPRAAAQPRFRVACPICLTTELAGPGVPGGLTCSCCSRTFASTPDYLDLTVTSGARPEVYEQSFWGGTQIFRSPLVSFAYERGWRQGFLWAGFPGADREFEMAMEYLAPARGEVLVDMSCGSGLFSRRFLSSAAFSGVIAADFSESMLRQAREYLAADAAIDPGRCMLLRADVGRQPFVAGSVAGIHAGAAIHCWPDPEKALAEVARVLRPGGVFVASTFLTAAAPLGELLGDSLVRPLSQLERPPSAYKWWEEAELRDLCAAVGLTDFQRLRRNRFIMFCARKPGGGAQS